MKFWNIRKVNKWGLLILRLFTILPIASVVVGSLLIYFHVYIGIGFNWTYWYGCFGNRCSTYQSGDLSKTDKAVDGIFGFGPGALSVISQLSSQGTTPKVFSHCLKGEGNGGGILVLGEILEPDIVYSPLVPLQYVLSSSLPSLLSHYSMSTFLIQSNFRPHYNLNLQSIAVNGQLLSIDPDVFSTSNNRGTIVDSGTTLAYLVQEAYDPFVNAVSFLLPLLKFWNTTLCLAKFCDFIAVLQMYLFGHILFDMTLAIHT